MKQIVIESPARVLQAHDPSSEADFERHILRCAPQLFPGYYAAGWKPIVRDGFGRAAQPDLVLVSHELYDWWVVEVELASHHVFNHVQPQLETLSSGIYDRTLIPSLCAALPQLSAEQLSHLVYREPGYICIVNSYTDPLHQVCRSTDFALAVVEPFHSVHGQWALLITLPVSIMSRTSTAGIYQLKRGRIIGNQEFLELPRHFPFSHGALNIVTQKGETEAGVHAAGHKLFAVLPAHLLPADAQAWLVMIDRGRRALRLEVSHE